MLKPQINTGATPAEKLHLALKVDEYMLNTIGYLRDIERVDNAFPKHLRTIRELSDTELVTKIDNSCVQQWRTDPYFYSLAIIELEARLLQQM